MLFLRPIRWRIHLPRETYRFCDFLANLSEDNQKRLKTGANTDENMIALKSSLRNNRPHQMLKTQAKKMYYTSLESLFLNE